MKKYVPAFFIFIFCLGSILFGQINPYSITHTDSLPVNLNNKYQLNTLAVVPFSEVIKLHGRVLAKNEYKISYADAAFSILDTTAYSTFDTLFITYQSVKIPLKKEYKRRSLVVKYDNLNADSLRIVQTESAPLTMESIFGPGIQKSGSLIRGFTVGSTRDFSLNSGLRLQLSGKLSDDIEITAALTDENTPIQPEGNTETLDELDKVFIQIKHPNAEGVFGDYDLNSKYGEFGVVNRKLKGLKTDFNVDKTMGMVSYASSKGKFTENQFTGTEGMQGPYRLYGANNERDIIIIAGSEKVYIDGEEMKRGENNDYTIEYSNAEVTFTPKRMITSNSRITVDFEYTDRKFSRNFFAAGVESNLITNFLKVKFGYFREGDNQDSPIDISLSDQDKKQLESAGDDISLTTKTGVTQVQPDSTGAVKGNYTKVDTMINGVTKTIYVYKPGISEYNVSFSYVGEGKGDYIREAIGYYRFNGIGQGSYQPFIYLPMPELAQVGNIALDISPLKNITLNLELAGSSLDKNRFSRLNDNNNLGSARNILLDIKPTEMKFGSVNLGNISFQYKDRFMQSSFTTLDRINEVEFNRNYNISSSVSNANEQLREATLTLNPINTLNISAMYGLLDKGENFNSRRYLNTISLKPEQGLNLDYKFDLVNSNEASVQSKWYRQNGSISYKWRNFTPGFDFLSEDKRDRSAGNDSLYDASLKYYELIPTFNINGLFGFTFNCKYSFRKDVFPIEGLFFEQSKSYTQYYDLNYHGIEELNSSLSLSFRNKKYSNEFKNKGLTNNDVVLLRSQNRMNFWKETLAGEVYYEASSERTARLEKVFISVPKGTGSYRYIGDLNNDGIKEENEFEPVLYDGDYNVTTYPTDQLFPVINVKTNTRWKLKLENVFSKNTFFDKVFSPVSLESVYRIEETSNEQDTKKIYLLHLSSFLNEQTTLNGFNLFQQDVFLFENERDFSLRFRFFQRKGLNQYNTGAEAGFNRERSIRLIARLIDEIGNQTDFTSLNDNLIAPYAPNRSRLVTTNSISSDFSYRPEKNVEVGFKITVGRIEDKFPAVPTIIDQNDISTRLTLSFIGRGRLRIEIERNELNTNPTANYIPFEVTKGNDIGKNYIWRLNFDYRITGNLQATANYDGRSIGTKKIIHTGRAEIRAYF